MGVRKKKRAYPRFKEEVKVCWRKLDSMDHHEHGETVDISEGGFRIEVDEEREVGEILEFIITDPSFPDKPINAFGRIVWVKRLSKNKLEAGIQLPYIPQEDKTRFNQMLYIGLKQY